MAHYSREEIMSSSEVVRNFGSVLSSVVQHRREKVAIIRNNRLEAVLVAADVYERLENACNLSGTPVSVSGSADQMTANSAVLLEFLQKNRLAANIRLSPEEIDRQIREERESWE